jgi:hypothetical protein
MELKKESAERKHLIPGPSCLPLFPSRMHIALFTSAEKSSRLEPTQANSAHFSTYPTGAGTIPLRTQTVGIFCRIAAACGLALADAKPQAAETAEKQTISLHTR